MQQIVTVVFLAASISEAAYADADCKGGICAQLDGQPYIECITDPADPTNTVEIHGPYTDSTTSDVAQWVDVAIDPIDGTIYVIYNSRVGTIGDLLGTIEDPLNSQSTEVTFVATLNANDNNAYGYTGLTFDCEGNLYGVTALGRIAEIDKTGASQPADTNSVSIPTVTDSDSRCSQFTGCVETLFYNYDDLLFYRTSSKDGIGTPNFYTRMTWNGADSTAVEITPIDDVCTTNTFEAAVYIGETIGTENSLVGCKDLAEILIMTGTPGSAAVNRLATPVQLTQGNPVGIWNYVDTTNNDLCKPPLCTDAPTTNPTSVPTSNTNAPTTNTNTPTTNTNTPTASPGDDDIYYIFSSESDNGSGSSDGALMATMNLIMYILQMEIIKCLIQ